jgi:hypothetical protein
MFRKFEQNGRIKITHHVPGDFFVEANPKRQKIPDFKRTIVNPVVNGLKAKITKPPARVVKFDLVERPSGYQAMTPTPRKLTDLAPVVAVSQMLQAARIEKLQIDAPDKANTRFWNVYNTWAEGARIHTLSQAINEGGQVNLVPIEINPLSISKWDWAVWFLSAMVRNKLIKKYQQTAVQLLKLFFETAQSGDVAQMTPGTKNVIRGWVFDEFSIVKMACQQLELPRDPEPYGFDAPYKVYAQEFTSKKLEILLYLTANAVPTEVDKISSFEAMLLDFSEVREAMLNPDLRLDLKTRQIERTPRGAGASADSSAPPSPRGPRPLPATWEDGWAAGETPGTPARPDREADADFYYWEAGLQDELTRQLGEWSGDYGGRQQKREEQGDYDWFELLFANRVDMVQYYELVGRSGILAMRKRILQVHGNSGRATSFSIYFAIVQTLAGNEDTPPSIAQRNYQPYNSTKLGELYQDNKLYIDQWVKSLRGEIGPPASVDRRERFDSDENPLTSPLRRNFEGPGDILFTPDWFTNVSPIPGRAREEIQGARLSMSSSE